jgi:hypothetical protein
MSGFHAVLVEGLFYEKDGSLFIEKDGGEHVSWDETMAPLLDQRVQVAVHHLPPHGIQPELPGAGSCRFAGGVGCPVRHDIHPDRLLSFHTDGVLQKDPWRVEKFDGSVLPLPLKGMPGHFGRVGAATIMDVEKMREKLAQMSPEAMLEALSSSGVGADELAAMLERLRKGVQ